MPSAVLSNVEQYLKKYFLAPASFNHLSADNDSSIALEAEIDLVFSAMTSISAVFSGVDSGTPIRRETFTPDLASILAKSVAPVKSSAIHPKNVVINNQIPCV